MTEDSTLNGLLVAGLRLSDSKAALIQGSDQVSYRNLAHRISRIASGLETLGVRAGDVVALLFENDIRFVEALLAIVRIGAVAMPVNVRQGRETTSYVIQDSGTRVAIAQEPSSSVLISLGLDITVVTVEGQLGTVPYQDLLAVSPPRDHPEIAADSAALLSYTSGSTGLPKGVFLTHAGLMHNVTAVADGLALSSQDRVLVAVPLFHSNAQCAAVFPCLLRGGSVAVLPAFEASAVVEGLSLHACTYLTGVPAMYDLVAAHIDRPDSPSVDLGHVRMALVGSAPVTADQLSRIARILPDAVVVEGYGLTEGGPVVSMNGPREFRPGSIGGGLAGAAVDKMKSAPSPLKRGELAYLAVFPDTVTIFKAKRGALKPKATDDVLASVPRAQLRASSYHKGKMVGVYALEFTDGSSWKFDVGRAFAKGGTQVAEALGSNVD